MRLAERFELVWATGWEERANEHLPHLLGLPSHLPTLFFRETPIWGEAHWKLSEIGDYARGRPAAWIDDSFDDSCFLWAESRREPTLLVQTDSAVGMTDEHVDELLAWASRTATASGG